MAKFYVEKCGMMQLSLNAVELNKWQNVLVNYKLADASIMKGYEENTWYVRHPMDLIFYLWKKENNDLDFLLISQIVDKPFFNPFKNK